MVRRKNASPLCGFATDERRKNRLVILSVVRRAHQPISSLSLPKGKESNSLVSRLSSLV